MTPAVRSAMASPSRSRTSTRPGRLRRSASAIAPLCLASTSAAMRCCGTEKTDISAAVKKAESINATKSARTRKIISRLPCSHIFDDSGYFGLCPFPADLNQLFDDAVVGAAVRFRLEVGHHPVPEHRRCNRSHIVEVWNAPRVHGSPRFRAQHQILRCAWPGTPANVALNEVRRIRIVGAGRPGQP